MRFRHFGRHSVVRGDGAMNTEADRLFLGRQVREAERPFNPFDPNQGNVSNVGHGSSRRPTPAVEEVESGQAGGKISQGIDAGWGQFCAATLRSTRSLPPAKVVTIESTVPSWRWNLIVKPLTGM